MPITGAVGTDADTVVDPALTLTYVVPDPAFTVTEAEVGFDEIHPAVVVPVAVPVTLGEVNASLAKYPSEGADVDTVHFEEISLEAVPAEIAAVVAP